MNELLEVMKRLRDPTNGCPWDLEQSYATLAPYTLEEAYEVVDAIERGDLGDLKEELGDLLLQVVFHAQLAAEQGAFDFDAVASGIVDKLIRRHPHVFGAEAGGDTATVSRRWEDIKTAEKAAQVNRRDDWTASRARCRRSRVQPKPASVRPTSASTGPIITARGPRSGRSLSNSMRRYALAIATRSPMSWGISCSPS